MRAVINLLTLVISFSLTDLRSIYAGNSYIYICSQTSPLVFRYMFNCIFNISSWTSKMHLKPKTFKLSYPKTYSTVLISETYSSILSLVQANKHCGVILDSFLTLYSIYWPMPLALPSNITESKAFPLPSLLLSLYHLLPKLFLLSLSLPAPTPPPTHPPPSN